MQADQQMHVRPNRTELEHYRSLTLRGAWEIFREEGRSGTREHGCAVASRPHQVHEMTMAHARTIARPGRTPTPGHRTTAPHRAGGDAPGC
jgi:hypothetical protein